MRIIILTLILLNFYTIGKAFAGSEENKQLLDSAEVYYTKGLFKKAADNYMKIINAGYEAPELYFNLGNAFYKNKEYTKAILYYERAKLLAPADEDINFNLELSKKFVVDKIDVLPKILISSWISKFTSSLSSDQWSYFSIGAFLLCLVLITIYLFLKILSIRKIAFWLGTLMFIISVITFICAWNQKKEIDDNKNAIVFAPTVNVKSSPDEAGTVLFVIHEGLKVGIQDKIDNWYKIKLSDGSVGWLKITEVEII